MRYSNIINNKVVSNYYSLEILPQNASTTLKMDLTIADFMTQEFPETLDLLRKTLPSIFESKCYNYENKSFYYEVKNTEIAHLFEHILIAYVLEEKLKRSNDFTEINGITKWKISSNFSYLITISIGSKDLGTFYRSLEKSLRLFNRIISTKQAEKLPVLYDQELF